MSQGSKFFQKDESSEEEQPKSKFFQQDDSEEDQEDQPTKSKFFAGNDDEDDDDEADQKEATKSKFFAGGNDDSDEDKEDAKKSKFFAGGDDDDEEEAADAKKSKFFGGGDDDDEEESEEEQTQNKNQKKKGGKKKGGKNKKAKPAKAKEQNVENADQKAPEVDQKVEEPVKVEEQKAPEPEVKPTEAAKEDDLDDNKKKSKGQKKKEKAKAKATDGDKEETKTEEPKAGEEAADTKATEAKPEKEDPKKEKEDAGKNAKKGKKPNAAVLKAQEILRKKREEEEILRKLQEEEDRRFEEARLKEEEEERIRKEEEEKRRKEKEEKVAKMKAEGTYKTKKEREREAFAEAARRQFLESGMLAPEAGTGEKKSKVVASKKKRPVHKPADESSAATDTTATTETPATTTETPQETKPAEPQAEPAKEEEVDEDDWEAMAAKLEAKEPKKEEAPKEVPKVEEKKVEEKVEAKPESKTDEPKKSKKKSEKTEEIEPVKKSKTGKKDKKEDKKEEPLDPNAILRSPICCIMGHVDTGKTKLLDKMRNTNVQEGEAGGITQQIGATFFPREKLDLEVAKVTGHYNVKLNVPGLLVIDTPGHESFANLRSRGSGLCDIVILVIDIMHGIQKQTLEAIELVKMRKTPYVIALNKIDRLYSWKPTPGGSSYLSLQKQEKFIKLEFEDRTRKIITSLNENSLNAALYYDNPNVDEYASIVPTSAHTGEGIPDLMGVVIRLTQRWLKKRIALKDEFKCTVLEVKVIEGLGATIDCILVNGTLREGDKIAISTFHGPIVTSIRALLTPHPMKEMRVKNEYIHHKEIPAAMGIKISADDLSDAMAGTDMYLIEKDSDIDKYMDLLKEEVKEVKNKIKTVSEGVCVAASTLGSLEALLSFLKSSKIPVASICIGPVSKEEVLKAMKPLLVEETKVKKEYATILAFDVKILNDAATYAETVGVKIFTANIIYHLFDQFTAYIKELKDKKKLEEGKAAVFPCIIKPVAFFNKKDPIIMGVDVVEGVMRLGTPLVVLEKDKIKIGTVESIEREHKSLQQARPADGSVAIRLSGDTSITAGRHFDIKDRMVSQMSRESIDALKEHFRDDVSKADWDLVRKLKAAFGIM